MIGRFKDEDTAGGIIGTIKSIESHVAASYESGELDENERPARFPGEILDLLRNLNVGTISPEELEQFILGIRYRQDGASIIINTNEIDVSAFMKLLVAGGARVEVFSGHDYPETD